MPAEPKTDANQLWRLVDPRLPLPWLVTAIFVVAGVYLKVQTLVDAVASLQVEVKAGNQSWATLAGEQALQKFRQGNTEEDIKGLKAAVLALQQRR